MFGFLKRRKVEQDPLTNLKTVSRWLQDLPAGDIYAAHEKVVQNLIQFNHEARDHSRDRLEVLMCLDEATRDMQASMCLQYLRNPRMSRAIEARLWLAIHAFYWEVTRGYHGFLMDFVANPGGSRFQESIPLITCRALRGLAEIIKWGYFRYDRPGAKLWLQLHNLYRLADFERFATRRLAVYASDHAPRSAVEEYGQALWLSLFGNGNLPPREIEMVDHWLDNWSDRITIDASHVADHHDFYVDTRIGQGLRRCRNEGSAPSLRFLSGRNLLAHLEDIEEQLKRGAAPVSLGLGEDFRLPQGYRLLHRAMTEWAPLQRRDRRRSARTPFSGEWRVVRDLTTICAQLQSVQRLAPEGGKHPPSPEELLDIKVYGFVTERTRERQQDQEREIEQLSRQTVWQLQDMSGTGLGFMVAEQGNEWVKVGRVIAVSPVEVASWQLGVISRIARHDEGRRMVGINLFGEGFRVAALQADMATSPASYIVDDLDMPAASPALPAILLGRPDGSEVVLMDSAGYSRGQRYRLTRDGASQLIQLDAVDDSGETWLTATFSLVTG